MAQTPPQAVYEAFIGSVVQVYRRVEIYESDGITPWNQRNWNRLVSGNVSVDYSRDDRRNSDFELDNFDGTFDHNPTGMWYDKVFKFFYGIDVNQASKEPSIVICEEYNCPGEAVNLKRRLNRAGYNRVRINLDATLSSDLITYDIVVSLSSDYPRKLSLLTSMYNLGKNIITLAPQVTAAQLPLLVSATGTTVGPQANAIAPQIGTSNPLNSGWRRFTTGSQLHTPITGVVSGVIVGAYLPSLATVSMLGATAASGARWSHWTTNLMGVLANQDSEAELTKAIGVTFKWLDTFAPISYYEIQLGEFLADSINDDDDDLVKVNCRDYTKRMLLSKLTAATMFTAATKVEDAIKTLGQNSRCFKFNLPVTGKTLGKDMTYERDTDRWKIAKEIATAAGYEIFFDNTGALTLKAFRDPYLTPPELVLSTGARGNLVKIGKKASDTSIYNQIVVAGESSDSTVQPVFAVANNTQAGSNANQDKIGIRTKTYTTPLVTTTLQAQDLANTYLRVASLEEFELNFEAILFPWLEVGDIMENTYQFSGQYNPTRFLLTSLSFPLDLSPMSGTGKRVTIVL